jgi:hypothetical protein
MKIQFNNGNVQTCPGSIGNLFIAGGLAKQVYDAAAARPRGNADWTIGRALDDKGTLCVTANCSHCNQVLKFMNPKSPVFSHCGQKEACPAHVIAAIEKIRKDEERARASR